MDKLAFPGRVFFAMALVGFGILQFIYDDFVPGRAPAFPGAVPGRLAWAYLSGAILIGAGIAIASNTKARAAAILTGFLILVWALLRHIPEVAAVQNGNTITSMGKALALFGGAFAVAGSVTKNSAGEKIASASTKAEIGDDSTWLTSSRLLWTGRICLGAFLILGGGEHFIYPQFVATLMPSWIPGAYFWTYFAGVALIAGGAGMILSPTVRLASALSALMIFIWVIVLHIPRALAAVDAAGTRNEWTAVCEALAIAGTAFVIAGSIRTRKT